MLTIRIDAHSSTAVASFVILLTLVLTAVPAQALTPAQFLDCIGQNSGNYGYTCQLDARPGAPYTVPGDFSSTINITRSGIPGNPLYVTGTVQSSVYDTTLQRADTSFVSIMTVDPNATNVY